MPSKLSLAEIMVIPCLLTACQVRPTAEVSDTHPYLEADTAAIADRLPLGGEAPTPRNQSGEQVGFEQTYSGLASYYGGYRGRRYTASGSVFDDNALTAAHRWLPFGTRVRVHDVATGRDVSVLINDRGPFGKTRIIDLSTAAAERLGPRQRGVFRVELTILKDRISQTPLLAMK